MVNLCRFLVTGLVSASLRHVQPGSQLSEALPLLPQDFSSSSSARSSPDQRPNKIAHLFRNQRSPAPVAVPILGRQSSPSGPHICIWPGPLLSDFLQLACSHMAPFFQELVRRYNPADDLTEPERLKASVCLALQIVLPRLISSYVASSDFIEPSIGSDSTCPRSWTSRIHCNDYTLFLQLQFWAGGLIIIIRQAQKYI